MCALLDMIIRQIHVPLSEKTDTFYFYHFFSFFIFVNHSGACLSIVTNVVRILGHLDPNHLGLGHLDPDNSVHFLTRTPRATWWNTLPPPPPIKKLFFKYNMMFSPYIIILDIEGNMPKIFLLNLFFTCFQLLAFYKI